MKGLKTFFLFLGQLSLLVSCSVGDIPGKTKNPGKIKEIPKAESFFSDEFEFRNPRKFSKIFYIRTEGSVSFFGSIDPQSFQISENSTPLPFDSIVSLQDSPWVISRELESSKLIQMDENQEILSLPNVHAYLIDSKKRKWVGSYNEAKIQVDSVDLDLSELQIEDEDAKSPNIEFFQKHQSEMFVFSQNLVSPYQSVGVDSHGIALDFETFEKKKVFSLPKVFNIQNLFSNQIEFLIIGTGSYQDPKTYPGSISVWDPKERKILEQKQIEKTIVDSDLSESGELILLTSDGAENCLQTEVKSICRKINEFPFWQISVFNDRVFASTPVEKTTQLEVFDFLTLEKITTLKFSGTLLSLENK